jgi:hypothetical protein
MIRTFRRFTILAGLALGVALIVGLLTFVGTNPAGAANTLTVSGPSSSQTAGTPFSVTVTSSTNSDTSKVTLSISTNPGSGTLNCSGGLTQALNGALPSTVTFSGCTINNPGTGYVIEAADATDSSSGYDTAFNVARPAYKLAFTTAPSSTAGAGVAFTTQPVVSVEDSSGRVVSADSSGTVTLSITSVSSGAKLSCTTNPVTTNLGVAAYAGCSINLTGTYTLTASASGLVSAVSNNLLVGDTTSLAITPSVPSRIPSGSSVTYTAKVSILSGVGSPTGSVSFTVNGSPVTACTAISLSANKATCTLRFSTRGAYTVTATYSGDSLFIASSAQVTQVVVVKVQPKEIASFHPILIRFGSDFILRIHLYDGYGDVSGTVFVKFRATNICTLTLVRGVGTCRINSSSLGVGSRELFIHYAGQGFYRSINRHVRFQVS